MRVKIILVTGVAGSGKSTLGEALAERLGWEFLEGDTLHPRANLIRMARGQPLSGGDRKPWLAEIRREIQARLRQDRPTVIAVSALKEEHRRQLLGDDDRVCLVYLDISPELARRRVTQRAGHFF